MCSRRILTAAGDSRIAPWVHPQIHRDPGQWAVSGYAGARFGRLLELAGFERSVRERRTRNHALSEPAKERNRLRSTGRARAEHGFVGLIVCMRAGLVGSCESDPQLLPVAAPHVHEKGAGLKGQVIE